MVVEGLDGKRLGIVERFEIDRAGRLSSLLVRQLSPSHVRKRIAASWVKSVEPGVVKLQMSAAEFVALRTIAAPL